MSCPDRLEVLCEIAGGSGYYFALLFDAALKLFDAVRDNAILCGCGARGQSRKSRLEALTPAFSCSIGLAARGCGQTVVIFL
jgi:hypothetical protein